jgi:hypothetical protein
VLLLLVFVSIVNTKDWLEEKGTESIALGWPDPVFCTRCYESVSTDSCSSGLPAFSTFLSKSVATANSVGVR